MRLARIIRYVPNVAATAEFYARAFGLTQRGMIGEDFIAMETGETVLTFAREGFVSQETGLEFTLSRPEAPPNPQDIVFEVADVAGAHGDALAAGGIEVAAPMDKPWGQTVSYLRDPDGALIQLCSPLPDPL